MSGIFDRMLGRDKPQKGSGATAKERLKFVLVHDRIEIAPERMREMKQEIIAVIARYLPEIDPDTVDIAFEQSDRFNNKLVAEIPFSKLRPRKEGEVNENDDLGVEEEISRPPTASLLEDEESPSTADSPSDEPSPVDDTDKSAATDADSEKPD